MNAGAAGAGSPKASTACAGATKVNGGSRVLEATVGGVEGEVGTVAHGEKVSAGGPSTAIAAIGDGEIGSERATAAHCWALSSLHH
jgi:hypothetical protein